VAQKFKTSITIDDATSAASQAVAINVTGDTQNRLTIDAGGKISWGPGGTTAVDTVLYRSAADTLKTDDAFTATSLAVTGAFTLPTSDGSANQVMVTNGSGTVTWANQSGGGGGGGVTVSDTPPSSPSSGDLWFESDTGVTFVYYDSFWVEVGSSNSVAVGGDGAIQYASSGGLDADDTNFVWDATNTRLGIGTSTPSDLLELSGGNLISDGHVTAQSGGADGGIVLGQAFGSGYVGLRTAGMSETSSGEYVLISDGTNSFLGAGTGGTTYIRGGANSTAYELSISNSVAQIKGNLTVVDNGTSGTGKVLLPSAGGDGGLALESWNASGFFGAIATANMTSTEYMMISAGTHTYISAATGSNVYIRAGANSGTHELWLEQSSGKTYIETTNGVFIDNVLNMEPLTATEGGEIALLHGTSGLQDAVLDNYHSGSTYFRVVGDSTVMFRVRLDTRLYALGGTGRDVYINSNDTLVYNTSTLDLKENIVTVTAESVDDQGRSVLERARMLEALEYEYSAAAADAVPGNRYIGLAAEHVHDLFPTATTDYLDYDEDENGDPIEGTGRPVGWDNRAMIGVLWALWRDSDTKLQDALNRISVLEAG